MAKPKKPRFKVARHLGENVYNHPKALKRGIKPHRKQSEYGKQLLEKQKLREYYGLLERQFKRYVREALRSRENPGVVLVQNLERRLDNIVYRLGYGSTLRQARQIVSHGHIRVNDKKVDIPSLRLNPGDRISLNERSRNIDLFRDNFQTVPLTLSYLEKDIEALTGRLVSIPDIEEIPINVDTTLIIEFYSRS
ncbi:MAG TPA: 30S ribosomal protein S4 [Clostridiales bacterium]|nr:30S ribosomal protein S4 [Clostridiales bacterium]